MFTIITDIYKSIHAAVNKGSQCFFPILLMDLCPVEQTSTLFQFLTVFFTILLNSASDTPPVDICAVNFMLATQLQSRC